jgi:hypothetical protein
VLSTEKGDPADERPSGGVSNSTHRRPCVL